MPLITKPKVDHGAKAAAVEGIKRSKKWSSVQRAHIKKQPFCVCCNEDGKNFTVNVHHIFPFHFCVSLGRPDLELDQRNLMPLCESSKSNVTYDHHILVGHLGSFQSYNRTARRDARSTWHGMTKSQIQALKAWQNARAKRPKPLSRMNKQDKKDFLSPMNKTFPKK